MSAGLALTAVAAASFDEAKVTPGVTGFLVVAFLGVALFFLLRSMTRHLAKVNFVEKDTEPAPVAPPADEPSERRPLP